MTSSAKTSGEKQPQFQSGGFLPDVSMISLTYEIRPLTWFFFAIPSSSESLPAVRERDPEADGVPGGAGGQQGGRGHAGGASPGSVSGQRHPLDQEGRG